MRLPAHRLFAVAAVLLGGGCASRAAILTITRGGTYRGGEYSAIAIDTGEPVTIENLTVRGNGNLISSHYTHAKVTIRNVCGLGPDESHHAGRFISLEGFDSARIENCRMDRTEGIYLLDYAGDRSADSTVKILRNRASNIDGRRANPAGEYTDQADLVQFVQLDKVRHVPGMEIAWNEVVNQPDKSAVEDNISIYLSSGTAQSPLRIHDNFIRGGYAPRPAEQGYSGGGIMLGDGVAGEGPAGDSAFVQAYDNQVLDTSNYGIAISAGHDCRFDRNRIVSAGRLPDGRAIAAQNVGAYIWDSYKAGRQHFFNNSGSGNAVGWIKGAGRNDWWRPDAAAWEKNTNWPDPITPAVYQQEWQKWQAKLKNAGITVGVIKERR